MTADPGRTIVLWCPDWPIFAVCREQGLDAAAPIALTEHGLVFACSPAARRDGVARGLKLREAQYRSPGLVVLDYDTALDLRVFEPVVRRVEAAVPGVQLIRPGTLAMRARGPARYYGGEEAAAAALLETVAELGVPGARVGIADGPFAAEQAARAAREAAVAIVAARGIRRLPRPAARRARGRPAHHDAAHPARRAHPRRVRRAAAPTTCGGASARRGPSLHALAAGREQARVVARTPPPEFEVRAALRAAARPGRPGRLRLPGGAPRSSSSACGAVRLVCTGLRVELDDEGGGHSSGSLAASAVVHRRRRRRPRALAAAGCRHGRHAGSPRRSCGCGSCPSASTATGNHESGLWGGGPDERVHHGLSRVQACSGTRRCVTAAIGGGRRLAERQVLVPWGDRPLDAHGATRRGRGACPHPLPGDASSASALPIARARRARAGIVGVDDRGRVSAPPERFAVERRRGRARSGVGGSVAGRRALVGCRARPARAPVPGRRRRRLRVAARAATTRAGGPRRGTTDGLRA